MIPTTLWLLCLAALNTRAEDSSSLASTGLTTLASVASSFEGASYTIETGQITVSTAASTSNSTSVTSSSTGSNTASTSGTTTANSVIIVGGAGATSSSGNGTATSSAATATNTVPCNNYPEFCNRKYSNITEVCAHNSAFDIKNNAASNQDLTITQQLNDGIRMLQGETHWVNDTVYNCHTSCDLLNAGPWQDTLETLVTWLEKNPYDVVTYLVVNSDYAEGTTVTNYTAAIAASGIEKYLYEPAYIPQHRDQWPTLGDMILSGKRVVMFMDYNANQTEVPYVLDEFTHMFETPYSPTNQSFPCDAQRPPGLAKEDAEENYMYLANHNLNVAIDISAIIGTGGSILIPNTAELNITNGDEDQYGRLGAASLNCTALWSRPPNFLLVDYYNVGDPEPGSVFDVAAKANGVTYNRACCGTTATSAASNTRRSIVALVAALAFAAFWSR